VRLNSLFLPTFSVEENANICGPKRKTFATWVNLFHVYKLRFLHVERRFNNHKIGPSSRIIYKFSTSHETSSKITRRHCLTFVALYVSSLCEVQCVNERHGSSIYDTREQRDDGTAIQHTKTIKA